MAKPRIGRPRTSTGGPRPRNIQMKPEHGRNVMKPRNNRREPREVHQRNEQIERSSSVPETTNAPSKLQVKKDRKVQRQKKKFDFEKNSRTIFLGNVPNKLDIKEIEKLFKNCGPIESARIRNVVPSKEKLAPKVALITGKMHPKIDSVNAYIVFKENPDDKCVSEALKMNGKLIEGHHLRVDRAVKPMAKKETLTSRKKSIFVGNLRFDIRDDDLINHFKSIGTVNHVRIVRDRATGLGKGFAFVVFDERASVKKAITEMNNTKFKGREMRIKKVEEDGKDAKGRKKNENGKTHGGANQEDRKNNTKPIKKTKTKMQNPIKEADDEDVDDVDDVDDYDNDNDE